MQERKYFKCSRELFEAYKNAKCLVPEYFYLVENEDGTYSLYMGEYSILNRDTLIETDEEGNTYIYSTNRLYRIAFLVSEDEFFQIQVRNSLDDDFKIIQRLDKSLFVISTENGDDIFNTQNGSLEVYLNTYSENGEFIDQETIFQTNEDGVFHKGDILLKHKDIESLEDKVDENALKSHTNQLEITNLKNALYGSVLSLETDSNADLDKAILSDSVTVDEQVYPIVDNTRALLSEVKGKTQQFNQLMHRPYAENNTKSSSGITYTLTSDNNDLTIIANGIATSTSSFKISDNSLGIKSNDIIVNHKYLFKGCPSGGNSTIGYCIYLQNIGYDIGQGLIFTAIENQRTELFIYIRRNVTANDLAFKSQLYDLTAMGLDNITTVEEFNALFPNEMYEYDSGSLKTAEISGVRLYETDGVTLSGEIALPSKQTLNGVKALKDKLVITKNEDNDYYTLKRVNYTAKKVFDGTEDWKLQSTNDNGIANFQFSNWSGLYVKQDTIRIVCDKFENDYSVIADATKEGCRVGGSAFFIRKYASETPTVEKFKTWLSNNNTTLVYELSTPIEEIISAYLTLEQVSAMRRNGGFIEVVGNDNASYGAKPTVDLTVICEKPNI